MAEKQMRNVTDIIDIEYLQNIQDSLGHIVGITTVILDPVGIPVTRPTNLHAFCAMMQASETGVQMCMKANGKLVQGNLETKGPAVVTCMNSGLKTASVPIFLGDEYLGSWLIGQVRMSTIDESLIEKTAMKAGISQAEAKKNIAVLPVITEEEFENILNFLVTVTKALTDMVGTNAQLNERNEQLDVSMKTFRDFIDLTDLGAYLVDFHTGELLMFNSTYARLIGLTTEQITGTNCFIHMGQRDFCPFCPKNKLIDASGEPTGEPYVWENYMPDRDQWLSISSHALRWVDGRLAIMTTFMDITARKKEEERVAYLAYNDQRLEIPNSVKLKRDMEECEEGAYLICLDVQGLRKINDIYGRDAGDNLLKDIVAWVKSSVDGVLYRIEGDDFAILVHGGEQKAMEIARAVYQRFDRSWNIDMGEVNQRMYTGAHMGVIAVRLCLADLKSSLQNIIERVLSFAQKRGELILFDETMDHEFQRHMEFEVSLKSCVLNDMQGFSLNYQPIVDASTGRWVGLEALCRWTSPDIGSVPPDIFISEAEQLGLIGIISDWVFDEAIRQIKEWGLDQNPDFVLDVNLSPIQLRDLELSRKVTELLKKHDFPAKQLSLEITESNEIHFDDKTLQLLENIRKTGVSLSLDDFGVGYATFSNLKNLPVTVLKTDRSFVKGIETDAFLQHTVRIMVDFAHAAGLLVVAEGVETAAQRRIMERSGVNMIQGYYFSRPLTKEDLSQKLENFNNCEN